jgi:hypothetical protein
MGQASPCSEKTDHICILLTTFLGVFSPDGKLVKMLFNGFHPKGVYRNVYDFKFAEGMYIIQLKTSDESIVSRMIIR